MIAFQSREAHPPYFLNFRAIKFCLMFLGASSSLFAGFALAQTTNLSQKMAQTIQERNKATVPFVLNPAMPLPTVLAQPKPLTITSPKPSLPLSTRQRQIPTSNSLTRSHVNVEELKTISPDSLGTLNAEQGGFGINMWKDVSRSKVERLLPKLPVGSKSRAMRDLMRRLLLSSAKAPEGELIDTKSSDLIGTRVELLTNMGDISAAAELIKQVPIAAHSRRLLRNEVDTLFMRNDNARVCSLVASQIRAVNTAYWQKAHIFCQSLAGEIDKASLGASLLRETGDNDQVFHGLLNQLSGFEKYHVASLIDPEPLYFAMVRAANADLPADVTSSNNPAILRTIATSPNARPELRLDAAERAESMGALNTEVLRQLYAGVTISDSALENPVTTGDSKRSPLSRARQYRKALVEGVPTATVELLSRAFKDAREAGRYQSMARVFSPILKGITPTHDFIWFIPEAIRALLTAGDIESTAPWFSILRSSAMLNVEASKIQKEILPLAKLAGTIKDEDWQPKMLADWWVAINQVYAKNSDEPDLSYNMATLVYCLLDGLGEEVPNDQWEIIMEGPMQTSTVMPQPAIWRSLEKAASGSRIGETVLLSLLAIGQAGPLQANPIVLRKVLISLRKIGMEKEARALALEAAIASGL